MKEELVKINKTVLDLMNLPRRERRRIARKHGIKNIPSIVNVKITKAPPQEHAKDI